jgi:hypothetical protein
LLQRFVKRRPDGVCTPLMLPLAESWLAAAHLPSLCGTLSGVDHHTSSFGKQDTVLMRQIVWNLAIALVVEACAAPVLAHGPQLQISIDNDKLTTRKILLEEPYASRTPEKRVYVIPILPFQGAWYSRPNNDVHPITHLPTYFSGPGLAYGSDQADGGPRAFAADSVPSLNFTDGLKWWNGGAFADPGTEQIEAFRGMPAAPSASAVTADIGPFASLSFPPVVAGYNANAHSSARFRLLGNGTDPFSASQDGIYLLSLQVTSDQLGLARSNEFYFILHKNAAEEDVSAAVQSLGFATSLVQVVPEPASIALAVSGAAAFVLAARPRRRRREDVT